MDIHSAKLIYFSPTGTTRRVLEGIARGMPLASVETIDLTRPPAALPPAAPPGGVQHGELVLIGAPVYGGRVPHEAARRLQRLQGHNTPAVVVVVYGNRAYEDALLELRDLALGLGFQPIAAAAFIGEHSFHTEATPIASGRPDARDLAIAAEAGRTIWRKVQALRAVDEAPPLPVPGNVPYRERGTPFQIAPVTRAALCTRCGECAAACPTAAITLDEAVTTDAAACIWCCACVKACPSGARAMEDPFIQRLATWLTTEHHARKEPEVYV